MNGQHVARHEGGHTSFSVDITLELVGGATQTIVLRAEDQPGSIAQARGKQDWEAEPHAIWYHRTTGIWQPVWVEFVPETYISAVHRTPDIDSGTLRLDLELSAEPPVGSVVEVWLSRDSTPLLAMSVSIARKACQLSLAVPGFENGEGRSNLLWSPKLPNLLDLRVTLRLPDRSEDVVTTYAGMRSCGVSAARFLLNDQPFFLRAVLEQGYWPESHLAAPSDEAIRREVELIKQLGFNAVRLHQKIEDPRFLCQCDRQGLLVWEEMPSAFAFSPAMAKAVMSEWMEAIERDRSHPCIVTWVPLNESWGVPDISRREDQAAFARALYHMTKTLDPTRPVIGNDGWEHEVADIVGLHDYSVRGEVLRERYASRASAVADMPIFGPQRRRVNLEVASSDLPLMVTEFGGISFHPKSGESWFGYQTVETSEAYLELIASLFSALHESRDLAGYCYTQLTDTLQEKNGLLDEYRKPKLDLKALRRIVLAPSRSILSEELEAARQRAINDSTHDLGGKRSRSGSMKKIV